MPPAPPRIDAIYRVSSPRHPHLPYPFLATVAWTRRPPFSHGLSHAYLALAYLE